MKKYRTETDLIGTREISADSMWGIHTERALENFQLSGRAVHPELVKAFGAVKLACFRTTRQLGYFPETQKAEAIEQACAETASGLLNDFIVVDSLQGGAGTSTNMNANEVIANRTLEIAGKEKGDYSFISPIDHVNSHQSANDIYPTTPKMPMFLLRFSGMLKACAVSILKISNDLRLMASGPDAGFAEIILPAKQAGLSVMPGKVVICIYSK